MSATDFFSLAVLILGARLSSEKSAFIWLLIFAAINLVIHVASWMKGGAS